MSIAATGLAKSELTWIGMNGPRSSHLNPEWLLVHSVKMHRRTHANLCKNLQGLQKLAKS
jgi:hypothetical protein